MNEKKINIKFFLHIYNFTRLETDSSKCNKFLNTNHFNFFKKEIIPRSFPKVNVAFKKHRKKHHKNNNKNLFSI